MKIARINKSVLKVIRLDRDGSGNMARTVLYKKPSKRKKLTSGLRPLEKIVRRVATAQSSFIDTYLEKHKRSNSKRRDGWLVDFDSNMARADNKGTRKLRLVRLITG